MSIATIHPRLGRDARGIIGQLAVGAILCCGVLLAPLLHASESQGVPDLSGVWQPAQSYDLLRTRDGKQPPLQPTSRKIYERNIAARRAGDTKFDNMNLCQPPGIPRALTQSAFRILQNDAQVRFLFDWNQVKRKVVIGGQPETEDGIHFMGDAVGTWDGNVLVVSSIHLDARTLLDDALPHSEALHVVERLRLVDNDVLEDVVTITDPETFSAPWTTVLRFKRKPSTTPWVEDVCTDRVVTPLTMDAE